MKIAFYKAENGTAIDKFISFATFSKYSHCEIVFSDGMCGSSSRRDGGVRFKKIDLDSGHWDIFDISDKSQEDFIRYTFSIFEGESYDYIGAIAAGLHIDLSVYNKKFCSALCSIVSGKSFICTPGGLYKTLINSKVI